MLKIYFYTFGISNILTSFLVPVFFGETLLWSPRNLATDLMVGSLYLAMGIVMIRVASSPFKHKAFVDFVVVSSILHTIVMIVLAQKPSHVFVDAGYMAAMGIIPLLLYPWPLAKFLKYDRTTEA